MTELDLDAFLQSHDNSNDDEHYHHHRTIDEILLSDSSSDTDSPPSSLNQSQGIHHFSSDLSDSDNAKLLQQTHPGVFDDSLGSFDETLVSSETSRLSRSQLDEKYVSSKFRSTNSVKSSGEVSGDSFSLSLNVLSPLSPFFGGGIRSNTNAKPGAALAAAAAASRSISTRHPVAIKSRRAASATLPKVLDQVLSNDNSGYGGASTAILRSGSNFEESSGVSDDVHDVAGCEVTESDGNFLYAEEDAKSRDDFQSVLDDSGEFSGRDRVGGSSADSEVSPSEKILPEVSHVYNDVNKLSFYDDDNSGNDLSSLVVKNQLASGTNADRDQGVECKDDKPPASNENNLVTFESIRDSPSTDEEGISYSPFCEQGKELTHADTLDEEKVVEPHSKIVGTIHAGLDSGSKSDADTHNEEKVVEPHSQIVGTIHAGLDSSSRSDATILIGDTITQSEKKRVNRRTGLKSWSSLKPLEVAEELEKKQAFTGLHWEEGAAAQPMRLEGVKRGSTLLGYFDINANNIITRTISSQAFRRDHGSPQSIAVHLNFIAIGMSRGVIVVQPSKYSPHYVDNMDAKMFLLGLQGDRSLAPVTAMCFSQQGDLLFAGYGDGHITVWEVQKASVAKLIHEHKAPVVHLLYLGQEDSQVTRQYNIVSGDNKGVIWLIHLTVLTWLNRYSYKTTKLFDETRSTVVCASPLISDESCGGALMAPQGNTTVSSGSISGMVGSVAGGEAGRKAVEGLSLAEGVVIFVTLQSALVAKVRPPQVEIYAQLSRPEGVREGSMPYTAWRSNVTVEASERISLLAIAWDRKVQVGKLVKSELKMYGTWTLDSSAIGVAWLDDQMLVVLTSTGHLCLFAKDGNMIHQTSFAVDGSRGDDFIAYHTQFSNIFGNPEKAYHNCVAVRGASIYVLGSLNLVVSRLLPWKERIEVLRKAGDWMGALNMAIALYDGQAHGIIDLPRALDDVQRAVMSYLVELLLSYVDEVFSYMTVAFRNQIEKVNQSDDSKSRSGCVHSEIKEQFTRVGGVAVEFCVHTKRTDILFDEIFSRFVSVQHGETFLELLEPYILKDMLGSLPPEIMQALVENYSKKGWLQRVEQCVLHMDISSLDFNQVVRLCREHRLYGALIYLFNKGLDDFRAPLEELIVVLQNSDRESAAALGYRILVYLKYCFSGLAFPPGRGNLPSTRLLSIRKELIEFLLEDSRTPNSLAKSSITSAVTYPNLYNLLELDNEATLDVLRCAFPDDEMDCRSRDSADSNVDPMEGNSSMSGNQDLLQRVVDVLAFIVDTAYFHAERSTSRNNAGSTEIWPSKRDIVFLFEFIAYYVACQRANITKDILSQILEHLTSETEMPLSVSRQNIEAPKRREKQLLALLSVVPETDWDPPYLLHLCEKAQFYQVCGFIHATRHNYLSALDSYLKDVDEPIHAFSFINDMLTRLIGEEFDAFKSAVISRISDLVILSREGTFLLIVDHLSRESEHILSDLRSHPESLFLYLKTVVELHSTGTLNFSSLRMGDNANMRFVTRTRIQTNRVDAFMEKISHFPKFLLANPVNITDHMIELYLELLCQYERNSVLKFLETFENYRVEHCLRLCQEYEITDAAAFLFERVGEAGTALLLMLSGLNDKFIVLEAAVGSVLSDTEGDHFETVLKNEEVNDILNVVHACVRLCQRNSPRLAPDESESLWFQLLDSFCEPLMDSRNDKIASEVEKCVGIQTDSFVRQEDEEAYRIKWKLPRSHKGVYILRKLFSMYIKEIVEGMIGYVRLPTIMSKLLSDNGSQEFGDFKHTIMGMLGMYDFERRILDTAKSLIEDDTFYTLSILKKGASHGYAPRSLICCICNCVFGKNISTSSIRIFDCGHANHIQCEIQENEALQRPFSQGCPICMPNKKAAQISENTSVLVENGSVSAFKTKLGQGSLSLHPHETDAFEKSYGLLPNARFEILANLQKDRRFFQVENINQLRLSPPAVYHEKVKKGSDLLIGESSSSLPRKAKPSRSRQLRDVKLKGSGIRFSLNSNIVGKEKTIKQ